MSSEKFATARFLGGMAFEAESGSGFRLVMDSGPEEGGESSGFSPMEIPLIALLGCTGMDAISTLRKMRQDVTGYELKGRGIRTETHPKVFIDIEVEHIFTGHRLVPESVRRAVDLSATRYCSVGGMLKKTATIHHAITLIDADTSARTSVEPIVVEEAVSA